MIKGILFDKDGTLLEFHSTMHHVYTNVFTYLKDRYSVPELLLQQLKNALGHLPDRLRSDSLLPLSTNPQIAEALLEPSEKYAAEHQWQQPFSKTDLLELIEELSLSENVPYTALSGVPETLKYLKIKGYKLGIATADTRTATVAGLKKTEICNYFDYLGTGDESKPKPETYLADMFCIQCGIAPNEMLIVGDSKNDMLFAENVGAYFIGIDTSCNNTSVFRNTEHKSVSNISEIIDIFNL
jgi:phosphoglycolate phosphatase